jgi:hypothetical protein
MGGMTSDCGDDDINLRPSYKEAETTGAAEISQSPDCPAQSDLPKKAKAAKSSKNPFKKRSLENVSYDLEDVEEKRKIARAVRTHGKTAARKAMQRGEL